MRYSLLMLLTYCIYEHRMKTWLLSATGVPSDNRVTLQQDNRTSSQDPDSKLNDISCHPWLQKQTKVNRLEIRAAFNMSINVLPMCLCTLPITLNAIAIYWCVRLQINAPILFFINPYLRDLFLIHSIYNPTMYMFSSTEFWRALLHFIEKWK